MRPKISENLKTLPLVKFKTIVKYDASMRRDTYESFNSNSITPNKRIKRKGAISVDRSIL